MQPDLTPFETLFGTAVHHGQRIEHAWLQLAASDAIAAIDGTPRGALLQAIADRWQARIHGDAACAALARRFVAAPPRCASGAFASLPGRLTDDERAHVIYAVHESLVRWCLLQRCAAEAPGVAAFLASPLAALAGHAFDCLIAIEAKASGMSRDAALTELDARVDAFEAAQAPVPDAATAQRDDDLHVHCGTVLRAGIWLVRHGHGQLGLLPYEAPSGCAWRCEFTVLGCPEHILFRYSSASGAAFLASLGDDRLHTGMRPEDLARSLLGRLPADLLAGCAAPLAPVTAQWLDALDRLLDAGELPIAFHAMSDDVSRWERVGPQGLARVRFAPQPGYRPPGDGPQQVAPSGRVLPVSQAPSADAVTRRAVRVLGMVHELHKAGYQRLRIAAGYSADGARWHCVLLRADDVGPDGWTPRITGRGHCYSSADGTRYFGWDDAAHDDARALAAKFLDRCMPTAHFSRGEDWAYAGWFAQVLGLAEHGELPAFHGGPDFVLAEPRTPSPPRCVPPPAVGVEVLDAELRRVPHRLLHAGLVPAPDAPAHELLAFAAGFDGSHGGLWRDEDCAFVTARVLADPAVTSREQLRTTAWQLAHSGDRLDDLRRMVARLRNLVPPV